MTADRKAVIVTGSSSGIGRATAAELARSGWNVTVHGLDEAECSAASAEVISNGGRAVVVVGDIRQASTAAALVDATLTGFGRIDGIVNNAGVGMTKPFGEIGDADWESILQTHLVGPTRVLRNAEAELRRRRGSVVNVSSLASLRALSGRSGYGAAKAAVDGLTRQLAAEWAEHGVRVNSIAPGTILTPLVERNFELGLLDRERVLERTPLGRLGAPSEIARVARFLLSDDASYITGQTINVDGGWSIWGGWK